MTMDDSNIPLVTFISKWENMNPAYRSSMEDVCVVFPTLKDKENIFFASLMDGHGGCATASFVASRIGENLYEALQQKDFVSYKEALRFTYLYTDVECRLQQLMASGCTCASLLVVYDKSSNKRTLFSANIGDSRVVLFSNGVSQRLSYDHKADDVEEINRIISSGGMVINKRVMGLLAVSRSFGDHSVKDFVIAEPFLNDVIVTSACQFVIIACDGVFDVMTDDEVCTFVKQCIDSGNESNCAQLLVEEAMRRDSKDNISVLVVGL